MTFLTFLLYFTFGLLTETVALAKTNTKTEAILFSIFLNKNYTFLTFKLSFTPLLYT